MIISKEQNIALMSRLVAVLLVFTTILGCSSKPSRVADSQQKSVSMATNNTGPDIDLNCVMNHIQNPPESFHYSFSDQSDNPWQEDAEVTQRNIDGSFMNNSLPQPQQFHGKPQEVSSNLRGIGRMASIFSTVHMTAAVVKQGSEQKNGYETVKYSIDTAQGTPSEQGQFKSIFGPGGFEKGTVWVTSQGCPVQIVLDEELHAKDGSSRGRAHYEEAIVKK